MDFHPLGSAMIGLSIKTKDIPFLVDWWKLEKFLSNFMDCILLGSPGDSPFTSPIKWT